MTISTRRRRKKQRAYAIAGVLLCVAAAALVFALRRDKPMEAAAPAPVPTASPSPPATAQPSPTAAPTPRPTHTPVPTQPIRLSPLDRSLYQAALSISGGTAKGSLSLTYVNNGVETLYALYLHLYPNAQAPGSLVVEHVALDGVRASYSLTDDGVFLHVPLINELRNGEAARVYVEFSAEIPRGGFGDAPEGRRATPLFGLVPTIAVYENEWLREATPGQVDYAPLADWRVLVQADIETEGVPSLAGGQVESLGQGRYLCTATSAALALSIG